MRTTTVSVPGIMRDLTFSVHEANDRHISETLAAGNRWEPFETEVLVRLLDVGCRKTAPPLFVDCGANIGWYSVVAAAVGANVFAFEPFPANAALLRANVAANRVGNVVEVHELALGRESGSASLQLSADNQGDHRLTTAAPRHDRATVDVEVATLDAVLAGRRPDVIKLDTQGSEAAILSGATAALHADISLIIEFWPYGLMKADASADELLGFLRPLLDSTHRCFEIREWSCRLEPLRFDDLVAMAASGGFSVEGKGFTNLLVVPAELVDRFGDISSG